METHVETHVSVGCFHFIFYASKRYFGLLVCLIRAYQCYRVHLLFRMHQTQGVSEAGSVLAVAVIENTLR